MCDISLSPSCLLIFFICSLYLSLQVKGQYLQFIFMMRAQCSCLSFGEEAPLLDSTPEFCFLSHNSMRKLKLKVTRFNDCPRMKAKFRASLALWVSVFTYQDFSMIIPSFVAYSQMLLSTLTQRFQQFSMEGLDCVPGPPYYQKQKVILFM